MTDLRKRQVQHQALLESLRANRDISPISEYAMFRHLEVTPPADFYEQSAAAPDADGPALLFDAATAAETKGAGMVSTTSAHQAPPKKILVIASKDRQTDVKDDGLCTALEALSWDGFRVFLCMQDDGGRRELKLCEYSDDTIISDVDGPRPFDASVDLPILAKDYGVSKDEVRVVDISELTAITSESYSVNAPLVFDEQRLLEACSQNAADEVRALLACCPDKELFKHSNFLFILVGYPETLRVCLESDMVFDAQQNVDALDRAILLTADAKTVRLLLKHGVDPHARNSEGQYPVFMAAANQQVNVVAAFIEAGFDIDAVDAVGRGLLCQAFWHSTHHSDRNRMVAFLIVNHADINLQSKSGSTPLIYAIAGGHVDGVKLCLAAGADVGLARHSEPPLEYTQRLLQENDDPALCANLTLIIDMLQNGLSDADRQWAEAMFDWVRNPQGKLQPVMSPAEAVAEAPKKFDANAFLSAADRYNRDDVRAWLACDDVDVNVCDRDGHNALRLLLSSDRPDEDLMTLLVEHGCDVNAKDGSGHTPLSIACRRGVSINTLRMMVAYGGDIHMTDSSDGTLLHQMANSYHGKIHLIPFLCDAGVDPLLKDANGKTARELCQSPFYRAMLQAAESGLRVRTVSVGDGEPVMTRIAMPRFFIGPREVDVDEHQRSDFMTAYTACDALAQLMPSQFPQASMSIGTFDDVTKEIMVGVFKQIQIEGLNRMFIRKRYVTPESRQVERACPGIRKTIRSALHLSEPCFRVMTSAVQDLLSAHLKPAALEHQHPRFTVHRPRDPNTLFVGAVQATNEGGFGDASHDMRRMVAAAKRVAGLGSHRLRTAPLWMDEQYTTPHRRPTKPQAVAIKAIDPGRKCHIDETIYDFPLSATQAGLQFRLWMPDDPNAVFLGFDPLLPEGSTLTVDGEDGFYTLTMPVKGFVPWEGRYRFAASDRCEQWPTSAVSEFVQAFLKKQSGGRKTRPIDPGESREAWLKAMNTIGASGSCLDQCRMLQMAFLEDARFTQGVDYQFVDIDQGTHIRPEVKGDDGQWHLFDLGGSHLKMRYDAADNFRAASTLQKVSDEAEPASAPAPAPDKMKPLEEAPTVASLPGPGPAEPAPVVPVDAVLAEDPAPSAMAADSALVEELEAILSEARGVPVRRPVDLLAQIKTHSKLLAIGPAGRIEMAVLSQSEAHTYCLDSIAKLDQGRSTLLINGTAVDADGFHPTYLTSEGHLDRFIRHATSHPGEPHQLLIDWDRLGSNMQVRLNTLFDEVPSLGGVPLPSNVRMVSICEAMPDDLSFTSRHQQVVNAGGLQVPTPAVPVDAEPLVIDLQGYPHWQKMLGPVVLAGGQLNYRPSDDAKALQACRSVQVINAPDGSHDAIKRFLQRGSASGFVAYHGCRIPMQKGVQVSVLNKPFDFSELLQPIITYDVLSGQQPASARCLNTHLFDYVLGRKSIHGGLYRDTPGWIEQAQGGSLSLYMTTALTAAQWYCLCVEAKKHQVDLDWHCAPGVDVPSGFKKTVDADEAVVVVEEDPFSVKTVPTPITVAQPDSWWMSMTKVLDLRQPWGGLTGWQVLARILLGLVIGGGIAAALVYFGVVTLPAVAAAVLTVQVLQVLASVAAGLMGWMLGVTLFRNRTPVVSPQPLDEKPVVVVDPELTPGSEKEPDPVELEVDPLAALVDTLQHHSGEVRDQIIALQKEHPAIQVYISNDTESMLKQIPGHANALVLDVEDHTYSGLLGYVDYQTTSSGFEQFKIVKSQLLESLEQDETVHVILKGQFTDALLDYLQPLMLGETIEVGGRAISLKGRLDVLIEADEKPKALACLPDAQVVKGHVPHVENPKASVVYDESKIKVSGDPEKFVKDRMDVLMSALQQSPWVCLVGGTAVGKSSLMRELESRKIRPVYRELECLDDWARDPDGGVLFIDESNTERDELTFLASMRQTPPTVFYQGVLYRLTDQHKVVFAKNPEDFGAGRKKQKLFTDHQVPELHFSDFPEGYLRERILQAMRIRHDSITSDVFSALMDECVEWHREACPTLMVRALQQAILRAQHQLMGEDQAPMPNKIHGTVMTPSLHDPYHALKAFLDIRQSKIDHRIPSGLGLNGFLMEGGSGTGKSKLAVAMLQHVLGNDWVKIDAGETIDVIKEKLSRAMREGKVVLFEEMNSVKVALVEKYVNQALTGDDPKADAKEAMVAPGFALIATINGAHMGGRQCLSPALMARCECIEMSEVTAADVVMIAADRGYEGGRLAAVVQVWKDHQFNLRELDTLLNRLEGQSDAEPDAVARNGLLAAKKRSDGGASVQRPPVA